MKKFIPVGIIGTLLVIVIILQIVNKPSNPSQKTNPLNQLMRKEIIVGEDVCAEFPSDFVKQATGKEILRTERYDSNITHACRYYTTQNHFLTIHVEKLNFEKQRQGLEYLDRPTKQDPNISMEHFVSWQGDEVYGVYLKLTPDRFISISRSTTKDLTNEDNMKLAYAFIQRINNGENQGLVSDPTQEPSPTKTSANTVPLPQETDSINTFFNLIKEGKPSDAVSMMSKATTEDDSAKQAWAVQFNAMKSVSVKSLEPTMQDTWTDTRHEYKTMLEISMDPSSANAPIPYYGWANGENIRWIMLVKEENLWKIDSISTGP
jgi:hypothetical protein